jgi:hypothetical protein
MSHNLYDKIDKNIISNLHSALLKHFYSVFYNKGNSVANSEGTPDIGGYTLIFLQPPVLSGFVYDLLPSSIITSRNSIFQALEFTPPDVTLTTDSITSSSNIKLPFALGKSSGGNLSIRFLENMRLDMYAFHHNWVHYIEQVVLGYMSPIHQYIESGELDYATSAFVMRFKPDMQTMVYLGKAVGIFPLNLPNKEIIGARDGGYPITTYSVNYACTDYREIALTGNSFLTSKTFVDNMWVLADFIESVKIMYGDVALQDIGSVLLHEINLPLTTMALSEASGTMF